MPSSCRGGELSVHDVRRVSLEVELRERQESRSVTGDAPSGSADTVPTRAGDRHGHFETIAPAQVEKSLFY